MVKLGVGYDYLLAPTTPFNDPGGIFFDAGLVLRF